MKMPVYYKLISLPRTFCIDNAILLFIILQKSEKSFSLFISD